MTENAAIAILDIGRIHDGVQRLMIDENVPGTESCYPVHGTAQGCQAKDPARRPWRRPCQPRTRRSCSPISASPNPRPADTSNKIRSRQATSDNKVPARIGAVCPKDETCSQAFPNVLSQQFAR
jgi:hypothetical protein